MLKVFYSAVLLLLFFQNCGKMHPVSQTTSESQNGGTQPPPDDPNDPLNFLNGTRSDVARILRPLDYQILSVDLHSTSFTFAVQQRGTYRIQILADRGNTQGVEPGHVYYSDEAILEVGTQSYFLPISQQINRFRGGWLLLVVRRVDNPQIFDWVRFGSGILIVTAGQSNSTNYECSQCGSSGHVNSIAQVRVLRDKTQNPTKIVTDRSVEAERGKMDFIELAEQSPIVDGTDRSVWIRVGKRLYEQFHVPIGFINLGWGGTSIEEWNTTLRDRFTYAKVFNPTLVLWVQGERDVANVTSEAQAPQATAAHETAVRQLMIPVMQLPSTAAPWVIALSTKCGDRPDYARNAIRTALQNIINDSATFPRRVFAGPDTDQIPHNCHFDTLEQHEAQANAWTTNLIANPRLTQLLGH